MKKAWAWPAHAAVWLAGLVLLFLVQPPRLTVTDPPATIDRFVEFVLAIVLGLLFAWLPARTSRAARRTAVAISAIFLVVGMGAFGGYQYLTDHWTCRYDGRAPMVIGTKTSPLAKTYLAANPNAGCAALIRDFAGDTVAIWDRGELVDRRLILSALFASVVISFAVSVVFMLRALAGVEAWRRPADGPGPPVP